MERILIYAALTVLPALLGRVRRRWLAGLLAGVGAIGMWTVNTLNTAFLSSRASSAPPAPGPVGGAVVGLQRLCVGGGLDRDIPAGRAAGAVRAGNSCADGAFSAFDRLRGDGGSAAVGRDLWTFPYERTL